MGAFLLYSLPLLGQEVCIQTQCYKVELAQSEETQRQGLMYRKTLAKNKGMLFIETEEKSIAMWMKNTFIPLDIIWINQDLKIVSISQNTIPLSLDVLGPNTAKYVLEINAGQSKKYKFKPGQKVQLKGI